MLHMSLKESQTSEGENQISTTFSDTLSIKLNHSEPPSPLLFPRLPLINTKSTREQ